MSSFLKIFPRPKSKEPGGDCGGMVGSFHPLETLQLEHSISAVAGNLFLNCKSCKALQQPSKLTSDDAEDKWFSYSGLVGVISKGIFMISQLDLTTNTAEGISYKMVHSLQIPHTNNPLVKPSIITARWIVLKRQRTELTVLVIVSNMGISIFSEDGTRLMCSQEYQDAQDTVCRAVGATGCQILAANGRGEIHIFDFCDGKVQFRRTDKVQTEPVTVLSVTVNTLATGSPSGAIRLWRLKDRKAIKVCCFKTLYEETVTGLGVWEDCIIGTFGSGVFRIFHLPTRRILARVSAHSRWIGTMDLLPHAGLLLTVSEDDAVLVWKLEMEHTGEQGLNLKDLGSIKHIKHKIKNIHQSSGRKFKRRTPKISVKLDAAIPAENMLLVGGRFLTCSGNVVVLSNYGAKELYFYSKTTKTPEGDDEA